MSSVGTYYDAIIQRVSDGEIRAYRMNTPWKDNEQGSDWFWWTDGNYGCDCNRYLSFERAGGNEPEIDDEGCECGDERYRVLRFELSDGSVIDGPDA